MAQLIVIDVELIVYGIDRIITDECEVYVNKILRISEDYSDLFVATESDRLQNNNAE